MGARRREKPQRNQDHTKEHYEICGAWRFLLQLEAEGLVTFVPHKGAVATSISVEEVEAAAVALVDALRGRYVEPGTGYLLPVNGDFTKLRYVRSLPDAAHRLLRARTP